MKYITNLAFPVLKIKEFIFKIKLEKQILFTQISKQKKECYKGEIIIDLIKKNWDMVYMSYRKLPYPMALKEEKRLYQFACKTPQKYDNSCCEFYSGNVTQLEAKQAKGINRLIYYTDKQNFHIYHSDQCCGMYPENLNRVYKLYEDSYCICFTPSILLIMNNCQVFESGHNDFVLIAVLDPTSQRILIKDCFVE